MTIIIIIKKTAADRQLICHASSFYASRILSRFAFSSYSFMCFFLFVCVVEFMLYSLLQSQNLRKKIQSACRAFGSVSQHFAYRFFFAPFFFVQLCFSWLRINSIHSQIYFTLDRVLQTIRLYCTYYMSMIHFKQNPSTLFILHHPIQRARIFEKKKTLCKHFGIFALLFQLPQ